MFTPELVKALLNKRIIYSLRNQQVPKQMHRWGSCFGTFHLTNSYRATAATEFFPSTSQKGSGLLSRSSSLAFRGSQNSSSLLFSSILAQFAVFQENEPYSQRISNCEKEQVWKPRPGWTRMVNWDSECVLIPCCAASVSALSSTECRHDATCNSFVLLLKTGRDQCGCSKSLPVVGYCDSISEDGIVQQARVSTPLAVPSSQHRTHSNSTQTMAPNHRATSPCSEEY